MTLKVLHVLDHSAPLHSGYAFRTLAILREQSKLGWRTLQLTTPKQGQSSSMEETVEGFRFLRTGAAGSAGLARQMLATAKRLREAVELFEPDLIHAHSPVLTAIPGLYVARRKRLPLVYEMRASWEDAAVDHGSTAAGSLRYGLSRTLETFVLRRAQHVTTICEGLRKEIVSRGIAERAVTVIPNAVDTEQFSYHGGSDPETRRSLGLRSGAMIGFIGSFYAYEGLDCLLEAIDALRAEGLGVQAVLVGGGPEEARLRRMVDERHLDEHVAFTGRVSQNDVQRYYRAIDILVYPRKETRLTEIVTPLKPLEAMAQGNLVLASDVGGHRELIRQRETGILFPAGDVGALATAIRAALSHREDWGAIRGRAREFVSAQRTWERSVAAYREAYRAALSAKGRSGVKV